MGNARQTKATAIHERTGRVEAVTVDGQGRVPRGYRTPTHRDLATWRGAELRTEIAKLARCGDVVRAEQAQRSLDDAIACGIAA